MDENYQAVVQKVIKNGNHGPYAVALCEVGTVTFSLEKDVWQEDKFPEPGTFVLLADFQKKRAGWRAKSGRFVRPSDERNPETRKEKRE